MARQKSQLDTEQLRARLKLRVFASEKKLLEAHASARQFFGKNQLYKLLSSGALAGSLLLTSPQALPIPQHILQPVQESDYYSNKDLELAASLKEILPPFVQPLTIPQEEELSKRIKKVLGINAVAILENNHLNQTYGNIGAEQHLARFPGDAVDNMAPGLGGWGYVNDTETEKYYVAVQTLYLPDWNTNTKYLADWYKFRHCLVVNPVNGKAIIAAVADAGPSWWTGKHFGGSPEVMTYLKLNVGMQKGPVILFFVDDPQGLLPLGPVEYTKTNYD